MHRSHRHSTIEALLTSRLLLLDKNPGLRPTGVGKFSKKNCWESNSISFENDVIECTGSLQACTGQEDGIEAAVHSLNVHRLKH